MTNMIVTGGYGGQDTSSSISKYADINWSTDQHNIFFNIANTHDIQFSIIYHSLTVVIKSNEVLFGINTYNELFEIKTHDIRFIANVF